MYLTGLIHAENLRNESRLCKICQAQELLSISERQEVGIHAKNVIQRNKANKSKEHVDIIFAR